MVNIYNSNQANLNIWADKFYSPSQLQIPTRIFVHVKHSTPHSTTKIKLEGDASISPKRLDSYHMPCNLRQGSALRSKVKTGNCRSARSRLSPLHSISHAQRPPRAPGVRFLFWALETFAILSYSETCWPVRFWTISSKICLLSWTRFAGFHCWHPWRARILQSQCLFCLIKAPYSQTQGSNTTVELASPKNWATRNGF